MYYKTGSGDFLLLTLTGGVGEFKLGNGAKAEFILPVGYKVTVIPKTGANMIERFDYEYTVAITNGGSAVTGQPQTVELNKMLDYVFTNTYTLQTAPLTINTAFTDSTKAESGSTIIYRIQGDPDDKLTQHIDLQVVAECNDDGTVDSITINGLPVGKYTVTQEKAWIWRYTLRTVNSNVTNPTLAGDKLSFTLPKQNGNYLRFNDEITYNKWVDGNSYKQNKFDS